jgi:hypothetical protein
MSQHIAAHPPVDAVIVNQTVKPAEAPASRGNWGRETGAVLS